MAPQQSSIHCVTCRQSLPAGEEPEYFAQVSIGYTPEHEAERAAEDVSQCLQYAQTVNSTIWDMLQVANVDSQKLCDKEHYLDNARSLCFLLTGLVEEVSRRVETLSRLIDDRVKPEKAKHPNGVHGVRKED